MNINYKIKYLKYKNKYLKLIKGGSSRSAEIETLHNSGYVLNKSGTAYYNQCFFISILHYLKLYNLVRPDFDISDLRRIGELNDITKNDDFGTENDNFFDIVTRICVKFNVGVDVYLALRSSINFNPGAFNPNTGLGIEVMPEKSNRISIVHLGRHFQLIVKYDRVGVDLTNLPNFNNIVTSILRTGIQKFQPIIRNVLPGLDLLHKKVEDKEVVDSLLIKETDLHYDIQSLLDQNEIVKLKLKQLEKFNILSENVIIYKSIIDENERIIHVKMKELLENRKEEIYKIENTKTINVSEFQKEDNILDILFKTKDSLEEIAKIFEAIENIDLKLIETYEKAIEFKPLYEVYIQIKNMSNGPEKDKLKSKFRQIEIDREFNYDRDTLVRLLSLYDQKYMLKSLIKEENTKYKNKVEVQQELTKIIKQIEQTIYNNK